MTELQDLTRELQRVTVMLGQVLERLDAAEKRADKLHKMQRRLSVVTAAVVLIGSAFLWDAYKERERMCDAMRDGFDQFTAAMVAAQEEAPDPQQVADFVSDLDRRLAACG